MKNAIYICTAMVKHRSYFFESRFAYFVCILTGFVLIVYSTCNAGLFVPIASGKFVMGDQIGEGLPNEIPARKVYVSGFEIEKYPVTFGLWREVYSWAKENGYSFENAGYGKSDNHPVVLVSFNDILKWCNARSEMEERNPVYFVDFEKNKIYKSGDHDLSNSKVDWNADGYRLPTEAEWEKAARGGLVGKRFPWGNKISHEMANYDATLGFDYDESNSVGLHPDFRESGRPYSNPVGHFDANQFGIYDKAGNVWEVCWDRYNGNYYANAPKEDPRGPLEGKYRVARGGSAESPPFACRVAFRQKAGPVNGRGESAGFRIVRGAGQGQVT